MPTVSPQSFGLYIHLPWCTQKCPYCDFNSHRAPTRIPEDDYIDALIRDIERWLPSIWGRHVDSIFIGGGTPSLFSPAAIDRLLSALRARLSIRPDCEITMEANPGSVEADRLPALRDIGINRLSLGFRVLTMRICEHWGGCTTLPRRIGRRIGLVGFFRG